MNCEKMLPKCRAECCGIVPIPVEIFEKHKEKMSPLAIVMPSGEFVFATTKDGQCAFLDQKKLKCRIYDDRPEVCRNFGDESHLALICPWMDKNGRVRSRQERRKISRDLNKICDKVLTYGKTE